MHFTAGLKDRLARAKWTLDNYPDAVGVIFFAIGGLLMLWLNVEQGRYDRLPITGALIISYGIMFGLPVFLVRRHRSRQQNTLDRIRGLYALACEMLNEDRKAEALRLLRSIRRWEQHWRIGESWLYQTAYSWFVMGATFLAAVAHYFLFTNVNSQAAYGIIPQKSLFETALFLQERPIALGILCFFAFIVGRMAQSYLCDLKSAPWAEFYGEQLENAIKAGRTVNEAPQHAARDLPLNATARELLGLPARFTAAELRQAWIRLARELHPDRWVSAGDGVRRIKEAALKRVNAARDELAPFATA